MTNLMQKNGFHGWYIGIMNEDDYFEREKETEEFGPFSKIMAKKTVTIFNRISKKSPSLKGKYAVAISGREALNWEYEQAERKAGWENP